MSYVTGRYIITHRTLGNLRSPRHTGNKSKKYNVGKPTKKTKKPSNIKKQTKKQQPQNNKQNNNNNNNNNHTCAIIITTTIIIIIFKICLTNRQNTLKYIPDKHNKIVQTIAEADIGGGGGGARAQAPLNFARYNFIIY